MSVPIVPHEVGMLIVDALCNELLLFFSTARNFMRGFFVNMIFYAHEVQIKVVWNSIRSICCP